MNNELKVIKTKSKQTFKNKEGKEKHYYNYWLQLPNGSRIQIKCAFKTDNGKLDLLSEYVG